MSQVICPECGAANLRRSRARGLVEKTQRMLGWKGYRCRHCHWRGMVWLGLSPQDWRNVKFAALLLGALLLLYVLVRLIFFLTY